MQIVIDIPEDRYNLLKRVKEDKRSEFEDYVYYGTPLPKYHGDLKDVEHYKKMQWKHPDYSLEVEPIIIEAYGDKSEVKE